MADAVETPAERGFEAAGPDRARGRQAPRSRDPACRPEATDAVAARRFRVAAPDSGQPVLALHATLAVRRPRDARRRDQAGDRKSVVSGKRVSVRVDPGGRRIIKKKKTNETRHRHR